MRGRAGHLADTQTEIYCLRHDDWRQQQTAGLSLLEVTVFTVQHGVHGATVQTNHSRTRVAIQ